MIADVALGRDRRFTSAIRIVDHAAKLGFIGRGRSGDGGYDAAEKKKQSKLIRHNPPPFFLRLEIDAALLQHCLKLNGHLSSGIQRKQRPVSQSMK